MSATLIQLPPMPLERRPQRSGATLPVHLAPDLVGVLERFASHRGTTPAIAAAEIIREYLGAM